MSLLALTSIDRNNWKVFLGSLPNRLQDVYFTPEYHQVFERYGDGQPLCLVYSHQKNIALNCGLLNSVNKLGYVLDKEYFDLQSVYGYSGLISSTSESEFINSARKAIEVYCYQNNIIAEFSRFHPLLNNSNDSDDCFFDRETVVVELTNGYEEVWKSQYSTNARNMVRKSLKLNYTAEYLENPEPRHIQTFIRLYSENMNKVGAHSYYHFNRDFFYNFFNELKGNVVLINIVDGNGVTVCASIFMKYKQYFHYHLSGRESKADNSVNSYLLDRAIFYAASNNFDIFHLGGGRSSEPDDSLLKFKKSFSPLSRKFFIEKKIYNKEVYHNVREQWRERFPAQAETYKNQLLGYRNIN